MFSDQRALTTEEEIRLDMLQTSVRGKVEDHLTRLNSAVDKGFISQSKYNELLGDTTLALGTFNQKVDLSQEKLQNPKCYRCSNICYANIRLRRTN